MSEIRICQNPRCGKKFAAKRKNSRYCCLKCSRKAYQLSNLELFAKNAKRWRELHPDAAKDVNDRYLKSHASKIRERRIALYHKDPEKFKARVKTYQKAHRREVLCLASMYAAELRERCETDAAFYASFRALRREYYRRWRDKHFVRKRPYRPMLSLRIPDYIRKDEPCSDVRSQFLWENVTKSQVAFAKELAIERKEYREVRNMV